MAQRVLHSMVAITSTVEEFHAFFNDEKLEILDVLHLTEKLDRIVYRTKEEFTTAPTTNTIPIAALVTAHGRMALYKKFIEATRNDATLLYCDTDSLVLKRNQNKQAIEEGSKICYF